MSSKKIRTYSHLFRILIAFILAVGMVFLAGEGGEVSRDSPTRLGELFRTHQALGHWRLVRRGLPPSPRPLLRRGPELARHARPLARARSLRGAPRPRSAGAPCGHGPGHGGGRS